MYAPEDDGEDAHHTPQARARAASRSTWVSVVVNVVLTCAQVLAGLFAHSQALVADGLHSLSDLVCRPATWSLWPHGIG